MMKKYRAIRPIVLGDTRHDAGVEIEMTDKQAAALVAAGRIVPVEPAAEATEPAPESKTRAKAKGGAE